jgi:hypothetical protein
MTLDGLKAELIEQASFRGHCMGPFSDRGVAECVVCLLTLHVEEAADGVRVGGSALHTHCETEITFLSSMGRG